MLSDHTSHQPNARRARALAFALISGPTPSTDQLEVLRKLPKVPSNPFRSVPRVHEPQNVI